MLSPAASIYYHANDIYTRCAPKTTFLSSTYVFGKIDLFEEPSKTEEFLTNTKWLIPQEQLWNYYNSVQDIPHSNVTQNHIEGPTLREWRPSFPVSPPHVKQATEGPQTTREHFSALTLSFFMDGYQIFFKKMCGWRYTHETVYSPPLVKDCGKWQCQLWRYLKS